LSIFIVKNPAFSKSRYDDRPKKAVSIGIAGPRSTQGVRKPPISAINARNILSYARVRTTHKAVIRIIIKKDTEYGII